MKEEEIAKINFKDNLTLMRDHFREKGTFFNTERVIELQPQYLLVYKGSNTNKKPEKVINLNLVKCHWISNNGKQGFKLSKGNGKMESYTIYAKNIQVFKSWKETMR